MSLRRDKAKIHGEHIVTAALALKMGQHDYTEAIASAIQRAATRYGGYKPIARAANSNIRAVENWAARRATPNGLHLLKLMATVPEVQAEVRRLASMEANLDPEFERDLNTLFRTYQRKRDGA